jgi:sensor domain CHASE-containing protein
MRKLHTMDVTRWVVPVVFILGLLITLATWHAVKSHQHSGMRWATKLAAQAIRSDIVTDMEWQMVGLDRLALLWEAADPPTELWIKNAKLYLEHRPGSVAVEWLTANGEQRAVITKSGNANTALAFEGVPKALLSAALSAASGSERSIISAPAAVSGDSRQWAVAHPVFVGGQCRGFIVSFFDF